MREGAVVLLPLAQADGTVKPRPAVARRQLPGFGDWLVCGVSTQLHQAVADFDEAITSGEPDFASSGLVQPSLIRLGFLQAVPLRRILGRIGTISPDRHRRLLANLSRHLTP
jgi:mRNA interferase MazF